MLVSSSSVLGGAERGLLELASELIGRAEWIPSVAVSHGGDTVAARCALLGIPFSEIPMPDFSSVRRPLRAPGQMAVLGRSVWGIMELVTARNARLVHANGAKAALCAVPAARWCGVPCVWHVRDYPRNVRVERAIGRFADAIVVPSNFMRDALVQHGIGRGERIHVVPNGVRYVAPCPKDIAKARGGLGVPEGTAIVTMVAQLTPWKRHDLFLEAVAQVRRKIDRPVHAVIAGGDLWHNNQDYAAALLLRAEQTDLRGCVSFLDQIPDAAPLLACSEVVVLPSEREPFGRVAVEAWHAGKPVVVSDIGCPRELIADGETGLVFPHGDAAALAACVARLLSDPALCAELGRRGNAGAQRFTPARHAAAISAIYAECVR